MFIRSFLSLLLIGLSHVWSVASAQTSPERRAEVTLLSERSMAVPGETIWLGLAFKLDPKWHIYWTNPGDAGIPPQIVWTGKVDKAALNIRPFSWPAPELLPVVEGQIMDYGYSDRVVLPFQVTIPAEAKGAILFEGVADYLICENVCIPETADIRLLQSVGATQLPDVQSAAHIEEALARVPPPFAGETALSLNGDHWTLSLAGEQVMGVTGPVRFFPYDHAIVHAADQPVRFGANGLQLDLSPGSEAALLAASVSGIVQTSAGFVEISARPGAVLAGTGGSAGPQRKEGAETGFVPTLPVLLLLGLMGGLILNLMPCVLPVLSIKALGIVQAAAENDTARLRAHGLWYTTGVLMSFAALALAILGIRAATGIAVWGFWLQNPVSVTVLILALFLIGLWLLGGFELGASLQGTGSQLAAMQGNTGAFFTGVLAAIVGAPCTGPFLGVALGAVMWQPALSVCLVLLAIGFGLALPVLLLSFMPGLQKRLPRPGAWMESLKQVFAFPMFLTAAWLLSVLGALAGYRTMAVVVAGAVLLGCAIWVARSARQSGRVILLVSTGLLTIIPVFGLLSALSGGAVNIIALITSGLILAGLLSVFWVLTWLGGDWVRRLTHICALLLGLAGCLMPIGMALNSPSDAAASVPRFTQSVYPAEPWSPQRVSEYLAQGRPVFVDFTAEWCVTCQANALQTLHTRPVTEAFGRADVAFLIADFTHFDSAIARELKRHNRAGVPLYLWYDGKTDTPVLLPEVLSIDLVTGLVDAAV